MIEIRNSRQKMTVEKAIEAINKLYSIYKEYKKK